MRRAIQEGATCLDMPTVRPGRAMLNCTEVNGAHRNGWTGYTKVYETTCLTHQTNPARGEARRIISKLTLPYFDQPVAARGARLRELRWKNSAWLATAETIAGWNGFEIRNAGSGRSPVRKRSG